MLMILFLKFSWTESITIAPTELAYKMNDIYLLDELLTEINVIGCIIILFAGISGTVSTEIDAICEEACAKYPGTKAEYLITYREKTNDLKKKNKAVWALGELRDKKALPILEALYTGAPCDHSRYVYQKEVKKAIKKIKGEIPNPYFWR